jgi:RNA polymerase sigma-70 factor (ECF subfamily)
MVFAADEAAFRSLYERYNKKLTIFAAKMIGDRDQATDLVQDVWVRVIDQRKKPEPIKHVAAYLFRIARNLALDTLRKDRGHVGIDDIAEDKHPSVATDEKSELEEIVLQSLDKLGPDDREILVMNAYLGYGFDEIAEMQSKSSEAIWTRASRARAKLRTIVTDEARRAGIEITGQIKKSLEKNRVS